MSKIKSGKGIKSRSLLYQFAPAEWGPLPPEILKKKKSRIEDYERKSIEHLRQMAHNMGLSTQVSKRHLAETLTVHQNIFYPEESGNYTHEQLIHFIKQFNLIKLTDDQARRMENNTARSLLLTAWKGGDKELMEMYISNVFDLEQTARMIEQKFCSEKIKKAFNHSTSKHPSLYQVLIEVMEELDTLHQKWQTESDQRRRRTLYLQTIKARSQAEEILIDYLKQIRKYCTGISKNCDPSDVPISITTKAEQMSDTHDIAIVCNVKIKGKEAHFKEGDTFSSGYTVELIDTTKSSDGYTNIWMLLTKNNSTRLGFPKSRWPKSTSKPNKPEQPKKPGNPGNPGNDPPYDNPGPEFPIPIDGDNHEPVYPITIGGGNDKPVPPTVFPIPPIDVDDSEEEEKKKKDKNPAKDNYIKSVLDGLGSRIFFSALQAFIGELDSHHPQYIGSVMPEDLKPDPVEPGKAQPPKLEPYNPPQTSPPESGPINITDVRPTSIPEWNRNIPGAKPSDVAPPDIYELSPTSIPEWNRNIPGAKPSDVAPSQIPTPAPIIHWDHELDQAPVGAPFPYGIKAPIYKNETLPSGEDLCPIPDSNSDGEPYAPPVTGHSPIVTHYPWSNINEFLCPNISPFFFSESTLFTGGVFNDRGTIRVKPDDVSKPRGIKEEGLFSLARNAICWKKHQYPFGKDLPATQINKPLPNNGFCEAGVLKKRLRPHTSFIESLRQQSSSFSFMIQKLYNRLSWQTPKGYIRFVNIYDIMEYLKDVYGVNETLIQSLYNELYSISHSVTYTHPTVEDSGSVYIAPESKTPTPSPTSSPQDTWSLWGNIRRIVRKIMKATERAEKKSNEYINLSTFLKQSLSVIRTVVEHTRDHFGGPSFHSVFEMAKNLSPEEQIIVDPLLQSLVTDRTDPPYLKPYLTTTTFSNQVWQYILSKVTVKDGKRLQSWAQNYGPKIEGMLKDSLLWMADMIIFKRNNYHSGKVWVPDISAIRRQLMFHSPAISESFFRVNGRILTHFEQLIRPDTLTMTEWIKGWITPSHDMDWVLVYMTEFDYATLLSQMDKVSQLAQTTKEVITGLNLCGLKGKNARYVREFMNGISNLLYIHQNQLHIKNVRSLDKKLKQPFAMIDLKRMKELKNYLSKHLKDSGNKMDYVLSEQLSELYRLVDIEGKYTLSHITWKAGEFPTVFKRSKNINDKLKELNVEHSINDTFLEDLDPMYQMIAKWLIQNIKHSRSSKIESVVQVDWEFITRLPVFYLHPRWGPLMADLQVKLGLKDSNQMSIPSDFLSMAKVLEQDRQRAMAEYAASLVGAINLNKGTKVSLGFEQDQPQEVPSFWKFSLRNFLPLNFDYSFPVVTIDNQNLSALMDLSSSLSKDLKQLAAELALYDLKLSEQMYAISSYFKALTPPSHSGKTLFPDLSMIIQSVQQFDLSPNPVVEETWRKVQTQIQGVMNVLHPVSNQFYQGYWAIAFVSQYDEKFLWDKFKITDDLLRQISDPQIKQLLVYVRSQKITNPLKELDLNPRTILVPNMIKILMSLPDTSQGKQFHAQVMSFLEAGNPDYQKYMQRHWDRDMNKMKRYTAKKWKPVKTDIMNTAFFVKTFGKENGAIVMEKLKNAVNSATQDIHHIGTSLLSTLKMVTDESIPDRKVIRDHWDYFEETRAKYWRQTYSAISAFSEMVSSTIVLEFRRYQSYQYYKQVKKKEDEERLKRWKDLQEAKMLWKVRIKIMEKIKAIKSEQLKRMWQREKEGFQSKIHELRREGYEIERVLQEFLVDPNEKATLEKGRYSTEIQTFDVSNEPEEIIDTLSEFIVTDNIDDTIIEQSKDLKPPPRPSKAKVVTNSNPSILPDNVTGNIFTIISSKLKRTDFTAGMENDTYYFSTNEMTFPIMKRKEWEEHQYNMDYLKDKIYQVARRAGKHLNPSKTLFKIPGFTHMGGTLFTLGDGFFLLNLQTIYQKVMSFSSKGITRAQRLGSFMASYLSTHDTVRSLSLALSGHQPASVIEASYLSTLANLYTDYYYVYVKELHQYVIVRADRTGTLIYDTVDLTYFEPSNTIPLATLQGKKLILQKASEDFSFKHFSPDEFLVASSVGVAQTWRAVYESAKGEPTFVDYAKIVGTITQLAKELNIDPNLLTDALWQVDIQLNHPYTSDPQLFSRYVKHMYATTSSTVMHEIIRTQFQFPQDGPMAFAFSKHFQHPLFTHLSQELFADTTFHPEIWNYVREMARPFIGNQLDSIQTPEHLGSTIFNLMLMVSDAQVKQVQGQPISYILPELSRLPVDLTSFVAHAIMDEVTSPPVVQQLLLPGGSRQKRIVGSELQRWLSNRINGLRPRDIEGHIAQVKEIGEVWQDMNKMDRVFMYWLSLLSVSQFKATGYRSKEELKKLWQLSLILDDIQLKEEALFSNLDTVKLPESPPFEVVPDEESLSGPVPISPADDDCDTILRNPSGNTTKLSLPKQPGTPRSLWQALKDLINLKDNKLIFVDREKVVVEDWLRNMDFFLDRMDDYQRNFLDLFLNRHQEFSQQYPGFFKALPSILYVIKERLPPQEMFEDVWHAGSILQNTESLLSIPEYQAGFPFTRFAYFDQTANQLFPGKHGLINHPVLKAWFEHAARTGIYDPKYRYLSHDHYSQIILSMNIATYKDSFLYQLSGLKPSRFTANAAYQLGLDVDPRVLEKDVKGAMVRQVKSIIPTTFAGVAPFLVEVSLYMAKQAVDNIAVSTIRELFNEFVNPDLFRMDLNLFTKITNTGANIMWALLKSLVMEDQLAFMKSYGVMQPTLSTFLEMQSHFSEAYDAFDAVEYVMKQVGVQPHQGWRDYWQLVLRGNRNEGLKFIYKLIEKDILNQSAHEQFASTYQHNPQVNIPDITLRDRVTASLQYIASMIRLGDRFNQIKT